MRRLLVLLLPVLGAIVAGVGGARAAAAADECRGLQVCLPVAGPWVVIPARSASQPARVEFELRCPLPGYVIAGTDARLADPDIDVSFRGETGSPVGPGVTTSRAVVFTGVYVGERREPTTFRPFIGCVPTTGGGGRALTAASALRPTRPVTRRAAERRVPSGAHVVASVSCRPRETAVDASHAVGFRTSSPPSRSLIATISADHRLTASRAVATADASSSLPTRIRAVVQVIATCRRDVP